MESSSRRHHQRPRSVRGPPPSPLPLQLKLHGHRHARQQPIPRTRRNPSESPAADHHHAAFPMDDDAISTLMDVDGSPRNGAGFLDEEDGEGELFVGHPRGGRGIAMDVRGPLPFADFFNSFDGADFDDADLE